MRDQLKRILRSATSQSPEFGRQTLAAAKVIDGRLRSAAREFGEPHFTLQQLALDIRLGVVSPLAVNYAVHHEQAVVFVQRFVLLSKPRK